jgi:uncharacterized protein (TIGR03086 family)
VSSASVRWRRVAGTFGERVRSVTYAAWSNPSPCPGWEARDVVGHLVEWVPPFLRDGADVDISGGPSVDDDPAGAWFHLSEAIQAILDAPDLDARVFDHPVAGRHTLEDAIGQFVLPDVLIHTWDLSRATHQDETLDAEVVESMVSAFEAAGDSLEQSGQYGAPVSVPHNADAQTKLLALSGRRM